MSLFLKKTKYNVCFLPQMGECYADPLQAGIIIQLKTIRLSRTQLATFSLSMDNAYLTVQIKLNRAIG